mmetsp:Transcript_59702/g.69778  ORF Transcript_59702/g.69778 Transcript_59702/m.69778 type:complete len:684 (-) Transcript_59702:345-2396(-)|eukprot:CAMPEP_0194379240 /NCGR_PEP_ID=MMETSP0174-20130528/38725_1 /TAXON_ID=216777 /ORGANISM="Proboscia alata, Strain PI-D3" /LENGTH=683 /DNA_ID=CAMNT_0039161831 /DNA_START=111 /DNA_END=2162 /DNA_ORIENTATION=+
MSQKQGLNRKKSSEVDVQKRIVLIDAEKCKPNSSAFGYLKRYSKTCPSGKECIRVERKTVTVMETACATCVSRCKQCPGDAVSVVNLPSNLTTDTTHRYGPNSFKLHGLPIPRPGHVLGLLGTNGSGKSTALKILMGKTKPNLGNCQPPSPEWSEIVRYYRGSDLQNYFTQIIEDKLRVAIKPQLEASFARRLKGKTVRESIEARDDRKRMDVVCEALELNHILDREIQDLSGGELQRFAVACTVCKDADVYMFDEVSSFLDVKQRLCVTDLIRSLVHGGSEQWKGGEMEASKKYVIIVEHDLAILDYMSDFVQCLYGESGAYGVVTSRSRVRNGINQYLAGYINAENMRFRDHAITFKVGAASDFLVGNEDDDDDKNDDKDGAKRLGKLKYPDMDKTHKRKGDDGSVSSFTLHVEAGSFTDGEIIALMGENGCGKTTFMELLAGRTKEQRGKESTIGSYSATNSSDGAPPSLASLGVSYKTQSTSPKFRRFKGTVQEFMEEHINEALTNRLFRLLVIKALGVEPLEELQVSSLSGGEMQRLAITVCLGTPALVYLIDEPSAGLDCEQRIIAAKVMRRWIVNHLGRTAFLVEHDFVMASAMADRVIVYEGKPGVECYARSPASVAEGFNRFLKNLNVTFRKDPINFRPRINKKNSRKDRMQKSAGEYYLFDVDEDSDDDDDDL